MVDLERSNKPQDSPSDQRKDILREIIVSKIIMLKMVLPIL